MLNPLHKAVGMILWVNWQRKNVILKDFFNKEYRTCNQFITVNPEKKKEKKRYAFSSAFAKVPI